MSTATRYSRRRIHTHWTTSVGVHGAAECGSTSIHYTHRTGIVTCPKCKKLRAYRAALLAEATAPEPS